MRRTIAWIAVLATAAMTAMTETGAAAEELPLARALELAAAQNPTLAAARSRAAAAAEEARGAERIAGWPRVGLATGWTATNTPSHVFAQKLDAGLFTAGDFALPSLNDPDPRTHLGTTLGVELPLDAFGKAAPSRRAARAAASAAGEGSREAELEVRLRVTEAWYRAVLARHALAATEQALAGASAREEQLAAQAAEGAALHAELLRARARRRLLEAELAARRGDERTAEAALALAIGVPGPVSAAAGPLPDPAAPGELAAWLARAADRPAVAAARAGLAAAAENATGAERSERPDLALAVQLQDDRGPLADGQTTGTAGVFLRWSLFDPQRNARRSAAQSARAAAEADLAAVEARARFEIESAWHTAVAGRERWLASSGGTEEGREAFRVVRERREAGLATLTDELETEAAALAAELAEIAAAADAWIARATLERAAGGSLSTAP